MFVLPYQVVYNLSKMYLSEPLCYIRPIGGGGSSEPNEPLWIRHCDTVDVPLDTLCGHFGDAISRQLLDQCKTGLNEIQLQPSHSTKPKQQLEKLYIHRQN